MGTECHRIDCMCSSWYLLKRLFGVKNNMEEAMFVSCLGFFLNSFGRSTPSGTKQGSFLFCQTIICTEALTAVALQLQGI